MASAQGGEPGLPVCLKALQSCWAAGGESGSSLLFDCNLWEDEKPLGAAQVFAQPEHEHRDGHVEPFLAALPPEQPRC